MRNIIQDRHAIILRAIRRIVEDNSVTGTQDDPPRLVIEQIESRDWASATFIGQHHRLDLRIDGGAQSVAAVAARLAQQLPTLEAAAGGHFLAEAAVVAVGEDALGGIGLIVEALTLRAD